MGKRAELDFSTLIFFSFSLLLTAQTEIVYSFKSVNKTVEQSKIIDNKLFFLSYKIGSFQYGRFHIIDLSNNTSVVSDSMLSYVQSVKYTDSGMFFITYANHQHLIHFTDPENNLFSSEPINIYNTANDIYYRPKHPSLCNGRFYINGYINGLHSVWESDGTNAGTRVIFQSENNIVYSIKYIDGVKIDLTPCYHQACIASFFISTIPNHSTTTKA